MGVDTNLWRVEGDTSALADPGTSRSLRAQARRGWRLTASAVACILVAITAIGLDANMPEWLALPVVGILIAAFVLLLLGPWVLVGYWRNRLVLAQHPWHRASIDVTTRHTGRAGIMGDALITFIDPDGSEHQEPVIYTTPFIDGTLNAGFAPLVRVVAALPAGPIPTYGERGELDRFHGQVRIAGPRGRRVVVTSNDPTVVPTALVALRRTRRRATSFTAS